jgi:copper(I)-binding protein
MQPRRFVWTFLLFALAAWLVAGCALPEPPQAGPTLTGDAVRVEDPMARPSPTGAENGAAYLTIVNPTSEDDRLVSAASTVAGTVELHETVNDNGVMRMVPQPDGFPVPARSAVELKPGGKHIMLIGLKSPLEVGRKIEITLHFQKAGALSVTVPVRQISPSPTN